MTKTLLVVVASNPVQSVGAGTHLFVVEQTSVPVQSAIVVHVTLVPVPPVPLVPPVPPVPLVPLVLPVPLPVPVVVLL